MKEYDESLYEPVESAEYDTSAYEPVETSPRFGEPGYKGFGRNDAQMFASAAQGVTGAVETAAQLVTGIGSGALATPVGAARAFGADDINEFPKAFEEVIQTLTYHPRSEGGKAFSEVLALPFEKAAELGASAGSSVFEDTGSPGLATAAETAVNSVPYVAPFALGKALGARSKARSKKAEYDEDAFEPVPEKPINEPVTHSIPETPELVHKSVGASAATDTYGGFVDTTLGKFKPLIEGGREVGEGLVFKAVTPIRRVGESSPTIKKLAEQLEPPEVVKATDKPTPPVLHERMDLASGRYLGKLRESVDSLRTKVLGKINKDVNLELVQKLRANDFTGKVGQSAKDIRSLLDDFNKYLVKSGVDVSYIPKYFPRIYRTSTLESDAGRNAFITVLSKRGIDHTVADMIVQRIVSDDGVFMPKPNPKAGSGSFANERMLSGRTRRDPNAEMARVLKDIPDSELAPFLENNVHQVLTKYIQNGVRRAEWARTFGPDGGKLNAMVRAGVKEAIEAGRPPKTHEIQSIYDLADAYQRTYSPYNKPLVNQATNMVLTYQYLRTLTFSVLSSLAEPAVLLERGRLKSTLKAVPGALKHTATEIARTFYKGLPKAKATKYAESIFIGLDEATVDLMSNLVNQKNSAITSAYFKANLLGPWTRFERVFAASSAKNMFIDNLKDLAKGGSKSFLGKKSESRFTQELVEAGIDPVAGVNWIKNGAKETDPFFEQIKAGSLRFVNDVIMKPRPSNLPISASSQHPLARAFWQLKKTQVLIGNTIMKRWYNKTVRKISEGDVYEGTRNSAVIASTGMLMIYIAILSNEFREKLKHGPSGNPKFRNETPHQTLTRAVDRAGFSGAFQFGIDATMAHRFGRSGVAQILGPTASQLDEYLADFDNAVANSVPVVSSFKGGREVIKKSIKTNHRPSR